MLLRHADSADKAQGQTDRERNLTRIGIAQAEAVAAFIKTRSLLPEHIVGSSAVRVRTTLDVVLKKVDIGLQPELLDELYEADNETYLSVVRRAGDCQSLLIVGHNPAITSFAAYVSKTKINGVGTGNLLVFQFKGSSWADLQKGDCELMEHFVPQP